MEIERTRLAVDAAIRDNSIGVCETHQFVVGQIRAPRFVHMLVNESQPIVLNASIFSLLKSGHVDQVECILAVERVVVAHAHRHRVLASEHLQPGDHLVRQVVNNQLGDNIAGDRSARQKHAHPHKAKLKRGGAHCIRQRAHFDTGATCPYRIADRIRFLGFVRLSG